jgi:membrane protein YdbS with pleckstrin-like domain
MANVCEVDREFEGSRCSIDKRVILIWMLPVAAAVLGSWILFSLVYGSSGTRLFGIGTTLEIFLWLLSALALFGIPAFIYFVLRYKSITYTVSGNEIVINEGIINKKRTVLPFMRIQNVYVRKPLLYRLLGMAYVEFETAGSMRGVPEGVIPGIANADEVVKDILNRVKEIRVPPSPKGYDKELLNKILDELKAIRKGGSGEKQAPMTSDLRAEIARILEASSETGESKVFGTASIVLEDEKKNPEELKKAGAKELPNVKRGQTASTKPRKKLRRGDAS